MPLQNTPPSKKDKPQSQSDSTKTRPYIRPIQETRLKLVVFLQIYKLLIYLNKNTLKHASQQMYVKTRLQVGVAT